MTVGKEEVILDKMGQSEATVDIKETQQENSEEIIKEDEWSN